MQPSGSIAALMDQYQQSLSRNASPAKNSPTKDIPTPNKKVLMPDCSVELLIKNQHTGSPSSKPEHGKENGKGGKSKQKKKVKSDPIVVSNSEVEEMEEQREKCQWVLKWKQELEPLWVYHESHNIFLEVLPDRNGGSHVAYLETRLQHAGPGFFFIQSFQD